MQPSHSDHHTGHPTAEKHAYIYAFLFRTDTYTFPSWILIILFEQPQILIHMLSSYPSEELNDNWTGRCVKILYQLFENSLRVLIIYTIPYLLEHSLVFAFLHLYYEFAQDGVPRLASFKIIWCLVMLRSVTYISPHPDFNMTQDLTTMFSILRYAKPRVNASLSHARVLNFLAVYIQATPISISKNELSAACAIGTPSSGFNSLVKYSSAWCNFY